MSRAWHRPIYTHTGMDQFFKKRPVPRKTKISEKIWLRYLIYVLEDGTTTIVTTRDTELTSIADGLTLATQKTKKPKKPKKLGASSSLINTFFISLLLLVLL